MNTNMTRFRWGTKIFEVHVLCTKVASALEGLMLLSFFTEINRFTFPRATGDCFKTLFAKCEIRIGLELSYTLDTII